MPSSYNSPIAPLTLLSVSTNLPWSVDEASSTERFPRLDRPVSESTDLGSSTVSVKLFTITLSSSILVSNNSSSLYSFTETSNFWDLFKALSTSSLTSSLFTETTFDSKISGANFSTEEFSTEGLETTIVESVDSSTDLTKLTSPLVALTVAVSSAITLGARKAKPTKADARPTPLNFLRE